ELTGIFYAYNKPIFVNLLGPGSGFNGRQGAYLKVKDRSHRLWIFWCSVRKTSYPKPVFSSGWLQFTRHYNLRIGDKITLRKQLKRDVSNGFQYKIEVRRKINLFGKDVWAHVL
ncbi:hypothetical protein Goshw_014174, partial [Gossypium schwendimanii]|nr:hypothetical protein [Gossypium schwendimanii]